MNPARSFADFKIQLNSLSGEQVRTTCPQCSGKRKNSSAKCLSVNTIEGVWLCFHCDWRGTLKGGEEGAGRKIYKKPVWNGQKSATGISRPEPERSLNAVVEYLAGRGIPRDVVEREDVRLLDAWMPQLEDYVPCLAFPFVKEGSVANIKYRALKQKLFRQVAGAEKILYRQDSIEASSVIITEGEIDALSLVAAGYNSAVSVPDGAPPPNAKSYASKFTYLDQTPDPFEKCEQIIIAVDADEPGQTLERELGRRLGTDRCWLVRWPEGCKDANEVLVKLGVPALQACIQSAKPFPVQDVVMVEDLVDSTMLRYAGPLRRGLSTGWAAVDQFYTVEPGQLTIITGIPGHGKSEWLDALMLNMAWLHGWRFAICSPENLPVESHVEKLLEKYTGLPFRRGPTERMNEGELLDGMRWLNETLCFIVPEEALSIAGLLERASQLVRRLGIRGLIIDPFNEFDHTRERGVSETEYIGLTLGALKRWARKWQVHVWLVAHPMKLQRGENGRYPVPTPWDINGSANFRNKADCCLTIWRMEETSYPVIAYVQKVRFKDIGQTGRALLDWDRISGRYRDALNQNQDEAQWSTSKES